MVRHRLAVIVVALALASAGAIALAQDPALHVSAVYKTDGVRESGSGASMTFTARLTNNGSDAVTLAQVRLANPSNTTVYAKWTSVSIAPGKSADVSDSISVDSAEYKRWRNHEPVVLWVVRDGQDTVATQVHAAYLPTGW